MFTRISRVLLVLGIIAGVIFSIAAGTSNDGLGWIIPVGIIATLVIFSAFGMQVEMAENVAKCKRYLKHISGDISDDSDEDVAVRSASNAPQQKSSALFKNLNITPTAVQPDPSAPLFWTCPECGEENDKYSLFCIKCGKHK